MKYKIWEKFYTDSNQLTKPATARQLVVENDVTEFHQLIKNVLRIFLQTGDVHLGFKTYINQELRNDASERMRSNPPSQDVSLEEWSMKIFRDEKFGAILNYLEEYSNDFSAKASAIVNPLLNIAGIPLGGVSFLCFFGNYGFTPFGVHKEAPGEDGILFHLGPGKKQFYTWDDPKYNAILHNTEVFHDFDKMLKDARCYDLNPGDAMFIPHQVYHIANTSEFSLSLVMDYINPGIDKIENQIIHEASQIKQNDERTYLKPMAMKLPVSKWKDILDDRSIKQKMESAVRRKFNSLKSNAGILKRSLPDGNANIPNGSFAIMNKRPFQIFYEKTSDNRIIIFARGHQFERKYHPGLLELLKQVNDDESIKIESIREILEPDWDIIDIYSLISELLKVEAITVDI